MIDASISSTRHATVLSTILPALCGLVGTAITNAITYSKSTRRARVLKEASDRVDFWKKWLDTRTQLSPDEDLADEKRRAISELQEASERVAALYAKQTPAERYQRFIVKRQGLSWLRKGFLLYSPLNTKAWVTRVVFFTYLLLIPAFVIANVRMQSAIRRAVSEADSRGVTAPNIGAEHERKLFQHMDILLVILSLGFALSFRTWSYRAEIGVSFNPSVEYSKKEIGK